MLFVTATQTHSLPVGLLSALCYVESTHNVSAIHHDDGGGNSVGVCQVKLETAKMLGFKGTERQLMDPKVNVEYAAKYLKKQLNRYGQNSPKAVAAYNAGTYHPGKKDFAKNQHYVNKVFAAWGQGQ